MNTGIRRSRPKRPRDAKLEKLLPKMLGILWADGQETIIGDGRHFSFEATYGDLKLGGFEVDPSVYGLHVYRGADIFSQRKVLSVYVNNSPDFADPNFYRHLGNTCGILSWRECGQWERQLVNSTTTPRPIQNLFTGGPIMQAHDFPGSLN